MADDVIPQRELRNDVAAVLRRVEAGERLTVSVRGRPVARLAPVGDPTELTTSARFLGAVSGTLTRAGAASLREDLAAAAGQTIDEL
jgi:prevent-host-death family protein